MEELKNDKLPLYLDFIEKVKSKEQIEIKKSAFVRKYNVKVDITKFYKQISLFIDFKDV